MAWPNQSTRDAIKLQKSLIRRCEDKGTKSSDVAACARAWCELEYAKREWRGLPRLVGHTLEQLGKWRAMLNARRATAIITDAVEVEAEATKESLIPPTVPAPPTPDPQ